MDKLQSALLKRVSLLDDLGQVLTRDQCVPTPPACTSEVHDFRLAAWSLKAAGSLLCVKRMQPLDVFIQVAEHRN
jgi:hypothetical protein